VWTIHHGRTFLLGCAAFTTRGSTTRNFTEMLLHNNAPSANNVRESERHSPPHPAVTPCSLSSHACQQKSSPFSCLLAGLFLLHFYRTESPYILTLIPGVYPARGSCSTTILHLQLVPPILGAKLRKRFTGLLCLHEHHWEHLLRLKTHIHTRTLSLSHRHARSRLHPQQGQG